MAMEVDYFSGRGKGDEPCVNFFEERVEGGLALVKVEIVELAFQTINHI